MSNDDAVFRDDLRFLNERLAQGGWAVAEGYTYAHVGAEVVATVARRGDVLVFGLSHVVMKLPAKGLRFLYGGGNGANEIHFVGDASPTKNEPSARTTLLGLVKRVAAKKDETP